MKIVYCCLSGKHASLIAGHIHLEKLPYDRVPAKEEITQCLGFDSAERTMAGIPYCLGTDSCKNEIYLLGLGKDHTICLQAICYVLQQTANLQEWHFVDACDREHRWTRWGNFCTDKLRLKQAGRFFHLLGIRCSYFQLVQRVQQVKERIKVEKA